MKITDVKAYVMLPDSSHHVRQNRAWTFVQVETDEGITGWGEATNSPGGGSLLTGETVPPEGVDALRAVREQVQARICVGERLFTRWDFLPVFQQRLADYVMPDVLWTGGISEIVKIATMAEAYGVPISPHNAMGPLQIVAGAHAMMTVPNFYRLEHSIAAIPHYNAVLTEPIDFQGGEVRVSGKAGLGVELDVEVLKAHLHPDWGGDRV